MCVAISIFTNTKSHDNTSNNAIYETKAHPFLHILMYYKRIFILRYNVFEHLKNVDGEYVQKFQNHKNC